MKKQVIAAAILLAASFGAFAAEPSYTYAQVGVARNTLELDSNTNMDFDGWNVSGSYEFAKDFHAFGGYQKTSNNDILDMDLEEGQIGLGWHPSIADNADAIVELSYINQRVEASAFGVSAHDSANGYKASVGFRSAFNDVIVGTLKANYTDGSDLDSEFTPSFGLEARFSPMWSVVGEAEVGRDIKRYTVGVRASF
ncbi:porin [Lysobacter sp. KIS68-7]|uniref:outer membrane beta-barrel protein n=1 Tax=Lysobacter sp. KIS68-7 TaxID=2904252 RepID=UPI001E2FD2F3|nr:outer membrane beta-barrel protein [Lysobacter sp. KIS68-7]UHQ20330.1 porin [Lysobacter sp. KIS68-7]